jgi:hypothetical protein
MKAVVAKIKELDEWSSGHFLDYVNESEEEALKELTLAFYQYIMGERLKWK